MDLNRLRKTGVILLAILLLAAVACTCESTRSYSKEKVFEKENISGRFFKITDQETHFISLMDTVESKFNYNQNRNFEFFHLLEKAIEISRKTSILQSTEESPSIFPPVLQEKPLQKGEFRTEGSIALWKDKICNRITGHTINLMLSRT